MLVRRIARPMLSAIFVTAGFNSVRYPDRTAPAAAPVVEKLRSVLPDPVSSLIPADPATAVRVNGAVHVVGGLLLATGRFPRAASLVLAATLVPTTLAEHAFWQEDDPAKRAQQQAHFFKNVSLLGGLLIAAVDTEGKPSMAWRGKAAAHQAGEAVASALPSGSEGSEAVSSLRTTLHHVADAAKKHGSHVAEVVKEQAPVVAEAAKERGAQVAEVVREQAPIVAEAARERGGAVAEAAREHGEAVAEVTREQAPVVAEAARAHGRRIGRRAAKRASSTAREARARLA